MFDKISFNMLLGYIFEVDKLKLHFIIKLLKLFILFKKSTFEGINLDTFFEIRTGVKYFANIYLRTLAKF